MYYEPKASANFNENLSFNKGNYLDALISLPIIDTPSGIRLDGIDEYASRKYSVGGVGLAKNGAPGSIKTPFSRRRSASAVVSNPSGPRSHTDDPP